MTLPPPTTSPAGWYPDPEAPDVLRWWDGRTWSDEDFAPITGPAPQRKTNGLSIAGLIVGIFVGLLAFTIVGIHLALLISLIGEGLAIAGIIYSNRAHSGRALGWWALALNLIPIVLLAYAQTR